MPLVLAGLLAVGGAAVTLSGCPTGLTPENGKENSEPEPEPEPEPAEKSGNDLVLHEVSAITATQPSGGNIGHMNQAMDGTGTALAAELRDMNRNIDIYKNAAKNGYVSDMPDDEFLSRLEIIPLWTFNYGQQYLNGQAFPKVVAGHVSDANEDLFMAYIKAYRTMNFTGALKNSDEDYTSLVNIGYGTTSVADVLQNINELTGTEEYAADGAYPKDAIRDAAVALLEQDGSHRLLAGLITEIGNLEQFMGLIRQIHARGMDAELASSMSELGGAAGGVPYTVMQSGILSPLNYYSAETEKQK